MVKFPKDVLLRVEEEKITGYLFNRDHPHGKPKADYFLSRGFQIENIGTFREVLKIHAKTRLVVGDSVTIHGRKVTVECGMAFPDGKERCVRTVWISERKGEFRLVTSYRAKGKD